MPRPLRIIYPNAWYHVMNRGAGRKRIFQNNSHRLMFLDLLEESHKMFNLKICAYCLMDNHYHLLLSTPDANLARVMRHINGVYTQKYNRSLKTDGPLFRGRYKAQLIEDDCYQLIVSRYIHLNPVEAGLASNPADYKWSSYGAYLGLVKSPYWLSHDTITSQLEEKKMLVQVKNYRDYVEGKSIEEINIISGTKLITPIIGSESFKKKMLSNIDAPIMESCSSELKKAITVPSIELIINHVCYFYNTNRDLLIHSKSGMHNWPKLVCIYICRKGFDHNLRAISSSMNFFRYEAVSTAVHKCHTQLYKNPHLFEEVNSITARIRAEILERT